MDYQDNTDNEYQDDNKRASKEAYEKLSAKEKDDLTVKYLTSYSEIDLHYIICSSCADDTYKVLCLRALNEKLN